ncbi:MAG: two-component sensor histidine kinase [Thaumarchaeota archaeon]|nr:two-component sensor histidine kinase [Nitrososphaerota archaeon]
MLGVIFGFGGISIFLSRNMFLEIKKFIKNIEKVSSDSYKLLKIERNDELGQLGNSINKLSEKFLKKSKQHEEKILELNILDNELMYKIQYLDDTKTKLNKTVKELTEQKELEKKHLSELEWRGKIVKSLADESKKADLQKAEFSSMISHELKTPLTPIISWCSILEQNVYGTLNPKQLKSIQKINENAHKLVTMIGDLLDVRKLDMEKMAFVFLDIYSREIIQSVYEEYENVMKEHNIKFSASCKENFVIVGDKDRIGQVLKNFLINAIDFVPENGKIEIFTKRNDPYVTFCVKDNGIGIAKEKQKNLFKKFYQVDTSTTREHGGSGLGLAICKGIVQSMNGLIGVESDLGKGAIFYFSLPISKFVVKSPSSIMK